MAERYRCASCQQSLPRSAFIANPKMRNGVHSWCRSCTVAATRAWRAANRDRINAARRTAYPRVIDSDREKTCRRCEQPFVAPAGQKRSVCDICQDQVKAAARARHATKPGNWQRTRVRILDRDGWICYLCGDPIPREAVYPHPLSPSIDHVQPRSAGGSDADDNLRAAHWSCNAEKGTQVAA